MGRGSSGAGKKTANTGIALLQGRVGEASTRQLMGVYDALKGKDIRDMTNEEKMVKAVVNDELIKREKLVYDAKTQEFVKNNQSKPVIYDEERERSYRVNNIHVEHYGTEKGVTVADADMFYNGQWVPIKSVNIRKRIASMARSRR